MQCIVSVIIPTYNRADVLFRAIESVKNQRFQQIEIIVIDDGSTDNTYDLLMQKVPEARIIRQQNRGPAAARNRGLQIATGKYVAFLDSDDEWLTNSLKERVDFLEAFVGVDMVFSDFEIYREDVCVLASFLRSRNVWQKVKLIEKLPNCFLVENFFECQLVQPIVQPSSVVIRRAAIEKEDSFDETLIVTEDWEFWLRFGTKHGVGVVDRILVRKYMQNDNLVENRQLWFENNVKADRKILHTLKLSQEQKRFIIRRLGDDMFEWGYHLINEKHLSLDGIKLLMKSFMICPSWKCIKCFFKAILVISKYGIKHSKRI